MGKQVESVVVFIVDSNEKGLLIRYHKENLDTWGLPKCILKPGERPSHCAQRAIKHHARLTLDEKDFSIMLCDESIHGHKIYFFVANVESFGPLRETMSLYTEEELRVLDRIDSVHRKFLWDTKTKVPNHE
tara:strand:+ start:9694 stop:10086 length:393 start_codon:yes stop_codon:yes gene_type:complete